MPAPVIVWLRPGVGYQPAAAASMARLERDLGREHDCNSSYRDYNTQLGMWRAWEAWVAGTGPRPNHSRALHPDASMHCQGLADDSDDWTTPGYIELAEEHGWIRTAADDPTERHHFEYQWWRDQHRNEPAGGGATAFVPTPITSEEEDMDILMQLDLEVSGAWYVVNYRKGTAVRQHSGYQLDRIREEIGWGDKSIRELAGPQPMAAIQGLTIING